MSSHLMEREKEAGTASIQVKARRVHRHNFLSHPTFRFLVTIIVQKCLAVLIYYLKWEVVNSEITDLAHRFRWKDSGRHGGRY